MVDNPRFKRIDGRLVRTDGGAFSQSRQRAIEQQRNERIRNEKLNSQARQIEQQFISNNFGGSIDNFTRQYNSISPSVRQRLKVTPQTVKAELNKRIKQLSADLSKSRDKEAKARRAGRKVSAKGEDAFQKGISQGISELRKGNLLSVDQVKSFANKLEDKAEKGAKLKAFNIERAKREEKKVLATVKREVLSKPQPKPVSLPSKKVLSDFKKTKFKQNEQQLFLKVTQRGQTITPQEKKQFESLVSKKNKDLTTTQKRLLKNAPKDVALGLFEVGKEIVVLGKDALVGSFNFGRNLRKRAEAGENNPLKNDISRLGKGTVAVSKFVKDNPEQAAAIVAAGSTVIGKDISEAFIKNPVKTTTKAVAYLFPGTVIKGGVKTAGFGVKGVKSTVQATNLVRANNKVKIAVTKGGLSNTQVKSVNNALKKASLKTSNTAQDKILKKSLGTILKSRGIKVRKGATVNTLAKEVAGSKGIVKAQIVEKVKPVRKAKVSLTKLKKAKVEVGPVAKITTPKKVVKKRPKKFIVEKGKIKEVKTLKELEKGKVKKKVGRPKKVKKQVKTIDVTKLEQKQFNQQLAQKGVLKKGDTTFIDLNAVARIEKAKKVSVKAVISNKKAQAQMQIQIQKSIRTFKRRAKVIKKQKKVNVVEFLKLDKGTKNLISLIKNTKGLRFIPTAALIKEASAVLRDLKGIAQAKGIKETPVKDVPVKEKAVGKAVSKAKAVAQAKVAVPKLKTPLKQITRVKKIPKKTTPRKPKPLPRLPKLKLSDKLPKGEKIAFDMKFRRKGKVITKTLRLPENKALKKAIAFIKRTPARSFDLVIAGTTKQKDINKPKILLKDFKLRKTPVALKLVEIPKSAIKGLKRTKKK